MPSENLQEQISVSETRQAVYSFLSRMYARELTKDDLRELAAKKDFWLNLANTPEAQGTEMSEGAKELAGFESSLNVAGLDQVELELKVEYAGLFLGVFHGPAHPSESAYENPGHLVMQRPRDEVLEIYRSMGAEKVDKFMEPEDHVAVELQFMSFLSEKTGNALREGKQSEAEKYLEVQRRFLDEHLVKWVPKLVADIMKGSEHAFYRSVAKITRGYVEIDKQIISEIMDNLAQR
jgi:TorA maturation chaperone TorD